MGKITIPQQLIDNLGAHEEGRLWLDALPERVASFAQRWSLTLDKPFAAEASCSWVAPCTRVDGTRAVFKMCWPHMEAEDEILAMRFLDGDPAAFLFEGDPDENAMLLEQCDPGTVLRTLPESEQDEILAQLLKRLWRTPPADYGFRPLSDMVQFYMDSARQREEEWLEPELAVAGLDVYQSLVNTATDSVLVATDLHAGNVLRAQREPWLVIDPKPFVGDPAYDATQHLLNCWDRLQADPVGLIARFANLLDVDPHRVQQWLFARLATAEWPATTESMALTRKIAP